MDRNQYSTNGKARIDRTRGKQSGKIMAMTDRESANGKRDVHPPSCAGAARRTRCGRCGRRRASSASGGTCASANTMWSESVRASKSDDRQNTERCRQAPKHSKNGRFEQWGQFKECAVMAKGRKAKRHNKVRKLTPSASERSRARDSLRNIST